MLISSITIILKDMHIVVNSVVLPLYQSWLIMKTKLTENSKVKKDNSNCKPMSHITSLSLDMAAYFWVLFFLVVFFSSTTARQMKYIKSKRKITRKGIQQVQRAKSFVQRLTLHYMAMVCKGCPVVQMSELCRDWRPHDMTCSDLCRLACSCSLSCMRPTEMQCRRLSSSCNWTSESSAE